MKSNEKSKTTSFDAWVDELKEKVVQEEYGYEEGEFTVYPNHWRQMYDRGMPPSAAFKRALAARETNYDY